MLAVLVSRRVREVPSDLGWLFEHMPRMQKAQQAFRI